MDALQKRWWENHAKYVELEIRKKIQYIHAKYIP